MKALRCSFGPALALLCFSSIGAAQEPVAIESDEVWDHRVGAPALMHTDGANLQLGQNQVALEVIVTAAGNVEFARATNGPAEYFGAAEKVEKQQKFRPFEKDGEAVRASFTDYVSVVPPEQWAETRTDFPPIKNWNSLIMRLKRTACFGSCPVYSVEVTGDGQVDFNGTSDVLVPGHHHSVISRQAVNDLVTAFRQANYFSLRDEYVEMVTDNPSYTTSIEFDGVRKSVRDYVGLQAGMPVGARDVELAVDRIAGTAKWIKGNEETGPALLAEKWNFEADTEENRALFANIVKHGSTQLVQLFLTHGAPARGMTRDGSGGLISAAATGNLELVKLMLADQPKPEPAVLSCALSEAARSGNLTLVQFLIEKGSDTNGAPCNGGKTALMKAAESGKAEVMEELLKHHPDVNAKDLSGMTALAIFFAQTQAKARTPAILHLLLAAKSDVNSRDKGGRVPLSYACSEQDTEGIRSLAAAGADVNARDDTGQTPLMSCFGNTGIRALIEAGADLTIRNSQGHTAAEEARQMGAIDKAELIEAALQQQRFHKP